MRGSPLAFVPLIAALAAAFLLGVWAQSSGFTRSVMELRGDVVFLAREHMKLVAVSGGAGILVGVPLGIVLTRPFARPWTNAVMQVLNIGTSIPTLAKMALAMTFVGIGSPPALVGLFVVTLLPVVTNTVVGIRSVPAHLIEAATGMGMTARQTLVGVELPNALFVILAGVRTALAINVGTVPLAFLIGGGGLGELIFTGIDLMEPSMLLAGAIPTALLAILVDFVVGQCQYWLIPRGVNPLR